MVFEIASDETWIKDLRDKPGKYASMGVQEYYAYDPHEVPLPASKHQRLFGWQLNQRSMSMQAMTPASNGALWSANLDSWLVPDGPMLRLYDAQGQMRLTYGEDEARQRMAETRRAEAMAEKLRSLGIDPDQLI